jgi:HSP20 family protein
MEPEKEKRVLVPTINVGHNEEDTGLRIRVNLAGASRDTLKLEMGDEGFCIKAEGEDFRYDTCHILAHRVKFEKAKAKFDSGLLTIRVPFDESVHGHEVPIE